MILVPNKELGTIDTVYLPNQVMEVAQKHITKEQAKRDETAAYGVVIIIAVIATVYCLFKGFTS